MAAEPNGTSDLPPSSLKPPRDEIVPGFWEQHSLLIIIGGICVLAILAIGVWLLLRPKPTVPVPAATLARQQLELLKQQPEDGVLLSKISRILRGYITAAFDLPHEELTTSEFCQTVVQNRDIGPELSSEISEFLRACDIRKFAPNPQPALGSVLRCQAIIDRAENRLEALKFKTGTDQTTSPGPLAQAGSANGMTTSV